MDIAGVDVEIDVIRELPELEDLEVNPSTEDQSFNSSKYGFKNVIIKGIKGEKLELNPSLEQQNLKGVFTEVNINPIQTKKLNITPTTQEQVITGLIDEVVVNAIEGQELNLNPSEEQQNYEGVFFGVNINPIQVEEITTDLDFSSSDAMEITAQEGAYIKKTTINKPSNLSPENIKSGETVCGIAGTNADTSDATATTEDILNGKTAYVNGEKIVGTLEVKGFDTSQIVNCEKLFYRNTTISDLSGLDTSNATTTISMCEGCTSIEIVPELNTSKSTNMGRMFAGCTNLKDLPFLDGSSTAGLAYYVSSCPNLTDESLNNVMLTCISAVNLASSYRRLKSIGLTSAQATRCKSLSNYQALINAEWITGY